MKKLLFSLGAAVLILGACERAPETISQEDDFIKTSLDVIPGQYVVLLNEDFGYVKSEGMSYDDAQFAMAVATRDMLASSGIAVREPLNVYSSGIQGFAVKLSESEVSLLKKNPNVRGVWPDMMFTLGKPAPVPTPLPAEVTPQGITRVGGTTYTGTKKAWIIDTGIDLDHQDLSVDAGSGKTFVARTATPDDDNGHGTHCAGIVGAIDNTVGVVGVAAGAKVVPVKVLDKRGSGAMSVIIAGVDYVTSNAPAGDAANMSLGGGIYEPLDLKVVAMGAKGIFVSLAAGNESDDANNHSPARANGPNVYTISACNVSDIWAYFSNYGNPPIDYCAPGVSILSTYKGNALATMSGTSMAAPHACGVLLLTNGNPKADGFVTGDPDGNPDPIIHK
ncbi:MAG: S8 family serine peptidase [Bacteroidales bacterium]|jgi:subtilisin family serine protease|nr:S8 family serine peptidase [Bacteroidales bacterium]